MRRYQRGRSSRRKRIERKRSCAPCAGRDIAVQPLHERQRGFAAALLDPSLAVPPDLVGPDGQPCPKRFAVYRNNIVVGLIEALRANFPAVCRIVGEEFFRVMARAHITSEPPHSPILLAYDAGFPKFPRPAQPPATSPY